MVAIRTSHVDIFQSVGCTIWIMLESDLDGLFNFGSRVSLDAKIMEIVLAKADHHNVTVSVFFVAK